MLNRLRFWIIALTAILLFSTYVVPAIINAVCWGFLQLFHAADKLALLF